jgi:iron complex outermembrane recepter protein
MAKDHCLRQLSITATLIKQRGLEASIERSYQPWHFGISYMKVDVKRVDSTLMSQNNNKWPVNVPDQTVRSYLGHDIRRIKGLRVDLRWIYEGKRAVLADNSIMLPAWNKWDLSLAHSIKHWEFQLYFENLFLKRYWKESPNQYGHVYLFPGMDRKVTLSSQYSF